MDFDDDGNTIQPIILPIAPPAAQVQRGNISNIARKSTIDEFREREIVRSYIGTMDQICPHCQARYWHAELNAARLYTRCCQNDTVRIPALSPQQPLQLFDLPIGDDKLFRELMSEDILYERRMLQQDFTLLLNEEDIYECLLKLEFSIRELSNGTLDLQSFGLPEVPLNYEPRAGNISNSLIREEKAYHPAQEELIWRSNLVKMNTDQQAVFETIKARINLGPLSQHKIYFLDAPGGTGSYFKFIYS